MEPTCAITGCDKPIRAGLCSYHYGRWVALGFSLTPLALWTTVDRFWAKVATTESGCWNWIGAKSNDGYGKFRADGTLWGAHRYSYTLLLNPIPAGLVLDHLCKNPSCVNPAHLEPVTNSENTKRGNGGIKNRMKSHCPKGHPYDVLNTIFRTTKEGWQGRTCRECARQKAERINRRKRAAILPTPTSTHCRNGHEYTKENTLIYEGTRMCLICRRTRAMRYVLKQRLHS